MTNSKEVNNMIVKYTNSCNKELLNGLIEGYPISKEEAPFELILNETYIVYGMILVGEIMWYYLAKNADRILFGKYPSPLFEVLDGRLSKYWVFSFICGEDAKTSRSIIAFPKWSNDPDFEMRFKKGDSTAVELFKIYKNLIDLEYPDDAIYKLAQIVDDECLLCNDCKTTWRSKGLEGMVSCPMCAIVMHNPRYIPCVQKSLLE